jgi:hypothetical protein
MNKRPFVTFLFLFVANVAPVLASGGKKVELHIDQTRLPKQVSTEELEEAKAVYYANTDLVMYASPSRRASKLELAPSRYGHYEHVPTATPMYKLEVAAKYNRASPLGWLLLYESGSGTWGWVKKSDVVDRKALRRIKKNWTVTFYEVGFSVGDCGSTLSIAFSRSGEASSRDSGLSCYDIENPEEYSEPQDVEPFEYSAPAEYYVYGSGNVVQLRPSYCEGADAAREPCTDVWKMLVPYDHETGELGTMLYEPLLGSNEVTLLRHILFEAVGRH